MRMTAAAAQLQFRVTNGHGAFDPARHEHFYTCPHPGGFKLQGGQLRPFRQATDAPYMLVADLDGTMVESNNHEAEGAMAEFCRYWEDSAVLRGGVLVYNTGRSLGQFTHLYADKRGKLALPDVLITAVGTKVRLLVGHCIVVQPTTHHRCRYLCSIRPTTHGAIIRVLTGRRTLSGRRCSTRDGT